MEGKFVRAGLRGRHVPPNAHFPLCAIYPHNACGLQATAHEDIVHVWTLCCRCAYFHSKQLHTPLRFPEGLAEE